MTTSEAYRVLVVDDNAEARENVRKLLQFESDLEIVGVARTGGEGIQLAVEHDPHVIIMDINMPDMDGITATEAIRQRVPNCEIVILSVQRDAEYMRKAMLVGARDYLTKPPSVEELISAVRRAAEMASESKEKSKVISEEEKRIVAPAFGKIVSIYSPKGGTGCTTLTSNLSVALHNTETPVAIVDANLQYGDVSFFFNEQGRNSIADLAPRADVLDMTIVEDVMIQHEASGVNILAAPTQPEQGDEVSQDQFRTVVDYLVNSFSYVIMDTASYLNDITVTTFEMSDLIILIVTQEIPSIRNAHIFYELMNRLGIDRSKILLVVNKFDKRLNITPEQISQSLQEENPTVIPIDERFVLPAMNRGEPFMMQNRSHPVAKGILSLVESIRDRIEAIEQAELSVESVRMGKL